MKKRLYKNYIDTPIGQMISISDAQFLHRLGFTEHKNLQAKIARLNAIILEHPTPISCQLEEELQEYFARKRKSFKFPLAVQGTEFQQKVWKKVEDIPFGQTRTYKEIAQGLAQSQYCSRGSKCSQPLCNRDSMSSIEKKLRAAGRLCWRTMA